MKVAGGLFRKRKAIRGRGQERAMAGEIDQSMLYTYVKMPS
jgi:hypothetical protein